MLDTEQVLIIIKSTEPGLSQLSLYLPKIKTDKKKPNYALLYSFSINKLITQFFNDTINFKTIKNHSLLKINKYDLSTSFHRMLPSGLFSENHLQPYKIDKNKFSYHQFPRTDIPLSTNGKIELKILENVDYLIKQLVDPLTGPILQIFEDGLDQLPLANIGCKILQINQNTNSKEQKIICCGISARECRNQVALGAIEQLFPKDNKYTFAAGWFEEEALFRCILNYYHYNNSSPTHINDYIEYIPRKLLIHESRLWNFLHKTYVHIFSSSPKIKYKIQKKQLVEAILIRNDNTISNTQLGLNPFHAAINLVQNDIIDHFHKNDQTIKFHPAHLYSGVNTKDLNHLKIIINNLFNIYKLDINIPLFSEIKNEFAIIAISKQVK